MKQYILIAAFMAGIAMITGSFYMGVKYQAHITQKKADFQEKKELEKIGDIKAGDVKHETKVKKSIERVDKTPDPGGCLNTDMPDGIVDELGGVREQPKTSEGRANP